MQRCSRCRIEKPDDDFAWRYKDQGARERYCRPCRAAYKQEHYAKNKQRYVDQNLARNRIVIEERMEQLVRYLATHPCVDCGEDDPVVLEFDHLRDKQFDVAYGLRSRRWDQVLEEITKCEVVCVNCHRRRTSTRAGFFRTQDRDV